MTNVLHQQNQVTRLNFLDGLLSRGLDLLAAGCGLVCLSPAFLLIGLVIKLTSPGPVFYRAQRVGRYGRPFKLYKFRTMQVGADRQGPGITLNGDPRVTRIGRFLRRTKLDELPQLINVFLGQMSLVGPRPEDPRYVALYTPEQQQLLAVRPGMTSAASLQYRAEEDLLLGERWETVYREQIMPHKLALDLAYFRRRSLWTDLSLIFQTFAAVVETRDYLNPLLRLRNRHLFALDLLALLLAPTFALTLRLESLEWWPRLIPAIIFYTLAGLLVKLTVFFSLGLYQRFWRYASVYDLVRVSLAVALSTILLLLLFIAAYGELVRHNLAMFRTVPLLDGLLTMLAVSGSRFGLRVLYHRQRRQQRPSGRRVLVVGAGEAGILTIRELRTNPQLGLEPVAFVDDDPAKIGTQVQGLLVAGSSAGIPELARRYDVQELILAIPSAPLARQRQIQAICDSTGLLTYSLPGLYELLAGHKTISRVPRVDSCRLLHREPVIIDHTEVAGTLAGQVVLVTGAGGSIGSELCRQIACFRPAELILLGHGENSIFEINMDLGMTCPGLATRPVIADVRDQARIDWVVETYRPAAIFHAAAHKHVPFMQDNVAEAITNNVVGSRNVVAAAERYGVERLVLISTDKAVNPTSIMGATKRLAELQVVAAARRSGRAYMAVRFGNVLGSRGSVVPVFQRQIAAGGPITITHPDMRRYFMTIPEAVELVLQASVLGKGGEIFVLDMGQPVRILDLATDLIRLAGLEPGRDIEIAYSGARPGEKLDEELFLSGEAYHHTCHDKIFVATCDSLIETGELEPALLELIQLAGRPPTPGSAGQLQRLLLQTCASVDQAQARQPAQLKASPRGLAGIGMPAY